MMASKSTDRETIVKRMMQAVKSEMRPEILRRFTARCVFNKLDWITLNTIGELHVTKCLKLINSQGHDVRADSSLVEYVQREGYSEDFGAAWMEDTAMEIIGDNVCEAMLLNGGRSVSGTITHDRRTNSCGFI
jgi:ATP-dependent Clp protease ATP-binding subunit ClpA